MDLSAIVHLLGLLIYAALAVFFVWGLAGVLLLRRQLVRRSFPPAEATEFFTKLRELQQRRDFDTAGKLCTAPEYWYRAAALLANVAVQNRRLSLPRLRQILAARFERDILADMENRLAWINTIVKSSPMLGLLGTVIGMIGAFAKIGFEGTSAEQLGADISVALYTTAEGLCVAVPLLLAASFIQVRMRKLEDATIEHVESVLDGLEAAQAVPAPRKVPAGQPG